MNLMDTSAEYKSTMIAWGLHEPESTCGYWRRMEGHCTATPFSKLLARLGLKF